MKPVFKTAAAVVISAGLAFSAQAQVKKKRVRVRTKAPVTAPEKVNVENLEKRYWAPKDKKFKVVQNRSYTKTNKFFLSAMPSMMLNEEYSKGFGMNFGLGYFFNDRWGLELEYQTMSLDSNDLQSELIGLGGFGNNGKTESYYGMTARWMPFYAKMSFLGTRIVYFDLSLGLSVGMMNYEQQFSQAALDADPGRDRDSLGDLQQSTIAYGFDISQSFYLSRKFLLRVDYKHRFYSQDLISGGGSNIGTSEGSRAEDSISLNAGITFIF